jgi:predicted PurR-regulated permease PerM
MITAQNWVAQQVELRTGSQIQTLDPTAIHETIATTVAQIRESIPALAGQFGGLLGDFVLVFIIGVYWLTSRDQAIAFILSLFSIGRRALINQIITEIETGLGNYTRGVVMVSVFVGIANFIIMSLLGVPNAVTLAFIVGVTTALPLVGGIIGAAAATLIAVLSSPLHALMTLGSIVAVQQVEAHYLTPRVMSRSVGLNPILIIVILFIGFAVGGVVGGLIAVPVAGTVMVLLRYLVIEPRKEVAAPQRTEGGILITTRDGRADAPPPVTVGTVVQPTTPPPVQTKPGT